MRRLVAIGLGVPLAVLAGTQLAAGQAPPAEPSGPAGRPTAAARPGATASATGTEAGYPAPLGTARARDALRRAVLAALTQTAAASTGSPSPATPDPSRVAALGTSLAATYQAGGALPPAAGGPPSPTRPPVTATPPATDRPTPTGSGAATLTPSGPAGDASADARPWLALALACLGLAALLLARRRR
jgi:hypothetical protein